MPTIVQEGRIAWGMQLPVQSQSTIYVEPWEVDAGPAEVAAVARAADAAGALYVAVCDHVAIPEGRVEAMGAVWWDTLTTLGWLAGITERVHLLSHVYVLPYRHPLQTAKGFCTLDALSGGRALLGVGAGHVDGEFDLLGVPFAERGRLLDEAIDVVRSAFVTEHPTGGGPRWPVDGVAVRPRPIRPGGPPIWVGGSSAPALRRAALRGDGWLPQGRPAQGMRAAIADLRAMRADVRGDDPIDVGGFAAPIHVGEPTWDVGEHTATGAPEQVADGLARLKGIGVDHVQVRFRARSSDELVDQITRFGAEVWPLVEEA